MECVLLNPLILSRRRNYQRVVTQQLSPEIFREVTQSLHTNPGAHTPLKNSLVRKLAQEPQPFEVSSVEDSIQDRQEFSRRLRLFLFRKKKTDAIVHYDKKNNNGNFRSKSCYYKSQEAFSRKQLKSPATRQQILIELRKKSEPSWVHLKKKNSELKPDPTNFREMEHRRREKQLEKEQQRQMSVRKRKQWMVRHRYDYSHLLE